MIIELSKDVLIYQKETSYKIEEHWNILYGIKEFEDKYHYLAI